MWVTLRGGYGLPYHPSLIGSYLYDALLKGRSVGALLSGENHDGVARELETQEISWPKLNSTTLLFGAAGDNTKPTCLLTVEATLLSTRLVTIEFDQGVGISLALPALEDDVLIEGLNAVEERASRSPQSTDSVDRQKHIEISWSVWRLNTIYDWYVEEAESVGLGDELKASEGLVD